MIQYFQRMEARPPIDTGKKSDMIAGSGSLEGKSTDCQSIIKMLDRVMLQVEYHCFIDLDSNHVDPLYKELCLIIAEVLVLDPNSVIKINGSNISVRLVKEVYSQIQNDHVDLVFINFNNVSHRVFNKRSYLRTALYNAVFENESQAVNDMRRTR